MTFGKMRVILDSLPKKSKVNFLKSLVKAKVCNSYGSAVSFVRQTKDDNGSCCTWIKRQTVLDTFSVWINQSTAERKTESVKHINDKLNTHWRIKT